MALLTNLTRRLWRWARAGLHLESSAEPGEDEVAPSVDAKRQHELEACHQALANAVNGRDRFREMLAVSVRARERCHTELRRAVTAENEESGAQHALRYQELLAEEEKLQEQLFEAQVQVDGLMRLREELTRKT